MPRRPFRLVNSLKNFVASTLYAIGALQLWIRLVYRHQPVVLTYHRVLPECERNESWSHSAIIVNCATFERHMRLLTRMFKPISLNDYIQYPEQRTLSGRPACLVTFDDGWIDTYKHAWPILQRYSIPAVVFLPINYIGTGALFWQERLSQDLHAVYLHSQSDAEYRQRAQEALREWNFDRVLDVPPSRKGRDR